MKLALVGFSIRQILASPARVILALVFLSQPAVLQLLTASSDPIPPSPMLPAMLLLSGASSVDRHRGLLRLILSRPVTRFGYLGCRWLGAWLVLGMGLLIAIGLSVAASTLGTDGACSSATVVRMAGSALLASAGLSAWFVGMSAILPRHAEMALLVACILGLVTLGRLDVAGGSVLRYAISIPIALATPPLGGLEGIVRLASGCLALLAIGVVGLNGRVVPAEARS